MLFRSMSEGTNQLLREGAIIFTKGEDIVEEYRSLFPEKLDKSGRRENVALDRKQAERLIKNVSGAGARRVSQKKEIDKEESVEYIDVDKLFEGLSAEEKKIIEAISGEKTHIDDIITSTGFPAAEVLSRLTMLEINGRVKQSSGKYFSLNY